MSYADELKAQGFQKMPPDEKGNIYWKSPDSIWQISDEVVKIYLEIESLPPGTPVNFKILTLAPVPESELNPTIRAESFEAAIEEAYTIAHKIQERGWHVHKIYAVLPSGNEIKV